MFEFIIYFICIVFAISLIVRAFSNISKNASRGDPIGTQYSKDDTYSYKPRVYGAERRNMETLAPQYLKIVKDCTNIINTTKNPDVFFERYELMITHLTELSDMEATIRFSGTKPGVALQDFLARKEYTVKDFIDRYYSATYSKITGLTVQKAKYNNAKKFYDSLMRYKHNMPDNCAKYIEQKYVELLHICNE